MIADKHYTIELTEGGGEWQVREIWSGKVVSRHRDLEDAEAKIRKLNQAEPNARDRSYRQGGSPVTGPERYS